MVVSSGAKVHPPIEWGGKKGGSSTDEGEDGGAREEEENLMDRFWESLTRCTCLPVLVLHAMLYKGDTDPQTPALEHASKVFGYAQFGSLFLVAVVLAVSSLRITQFPANGDVPRYNRLLYAALVFCNGLCIVTQASFVISTYPPIRAQGPDYAWHRGCFLGYLMAGIPLFVLLFIVPLHFDFDYHFNFLDLFALLCFPMLGVVTAEFMQQYFYVQDVGTATAYTEVKWVDTDSDDPGAEEDDNDDAWKSCLNVIQVSSAMVINIVISIGYPLMLIPIFRSDVVPDTARLFIACFIHPVLGELVMMHTRQTRDPSDPWIKRCEERFPYVTLSRYLVTGNFEATFIFQRRIMLGCITSPTVLTLAIVITGLEEVLMRTTMIYRDRWFRTLMGKPDLSEEEEKV